MNPIYKPKGAAAEYGDYALNIYKGCPHRCYYCFAPSVLRRDREQFHSFTESRKNIVEETRKQLERDTTLRGKLIHLCFSCDPYPVDCDSSTTREIIKLLKEYGNHVQILTKGDGTRDFDLLDSEDWYGITVSTADNSLAGVSEPKALYPNDRMMGLILAKHHGIKTWVSFEPVIDVDSVLRTIEDYYKAFDRVKIGKLNYHPSDINWAKFGSDAEALCRKLGLDYYIKDSLRAEMDGEQCKV